MDNILLINTLILFEEQLSLTFINDNGYCLFIIVVFLKVSIPCSELNLYRFNNFMHESLFYISTGGELSTY